MKNRKKLNPIFRIFIFVTGLILIAFVIAIGLSYYIFSIPEPEGLSLTDWPNRFTNNFSMWIKNENGNIKVRDVGLQRLDEYGLWLQIFDEEGHEVFAYNKPQNYPTSYSAPELIAFSTSTYKNGYTIFASSFESADKAYGYIIGFPYAIGKYMVYYNGERIERLSPVFHKVVLAFFFAITLFVLAYGIWLTRHLSKITDGIEKVSLRTYLPLPEKGMFSEIYKALNEMNSEIRHSDKVQQDTERIRKEWIVNITHDLKTPLSPIKGYAELLADNPTFESETIKEYGSIILKNVDYAEKLINDLKLIYQLDSGAIPYNPQEIQITRYLKELVIDIVNNPAFSNRNIEFESNAEKLIVLLDPILFRRAIENIIINALTHNPQETKVEITVNENSQKGVCICIRDNGIGISDEEQSELFNRYYRGTNTKEKPEGSGLGLAIAKQIVTLHDGDITVKSKPNEGTQFLIYLPFKKQLT